MAVGVARGVELDDPHSFCFSTAGLRTSRRLRLPLIDWPVRVRRCAHRQNEPRCCTRVNKCLLRPPGKPRVKPEPLPSSQQSPPPTDRIGQDELIHKTAHMIIRPAPCWILTLYGFQGFFPVDVSPCLLHWASCKDLQILQVYINVAVHNIKLGILCGGELVV